MNPTTDMMSTSSSESREIYLVGGLSVATGATFALLAALLPMPVWLVVFSTSASLALVNITQNSPLITGGLCALVVAVLSLRHPYAFATGWSCAIMILLFSDIESRSRLSNVGGGETSTLCAVSKIITSGLANVIEALRIRIGPAKDFIRTEFNGYRGITFSSCSTSCTSLRSFVVSRFSGLMGSPPLPVSPPAPVEHNTEKQSKACGFGKQTSGEEIHEE